MKRAAALKAHCFYTVRIILEKSFTFKNVGAEIFLLLPRRHEDKLTPAQKNKHI